MKTVLLSFSAATDGYAYEVESDSELVYFTAYSGAVVLSKDPQLKWTDISAPSSTGTRNLDFIIAGFLPFPALRFSKGDRLYFSTGQMGACIMIFNELS